MEPKQRIIKNFDALAISALRRQALLIAEAGFKAIATDKIINSTVCYDAKRDVLEVSGQKFELKKFQRIFLLAFGKSAWDATKALGMILGDRITQGFVLDLKKGDLPIKYHQFVGTHPRSSTQNIKATQVILSGISELTETDLIICAISGGGSSLLTWPYDLSAEEFSQVFDGLTKQGATITELNAVRKHLDRVKGGGLAKLLYPATVVSLIFSDVPGNDLSVIASGPTARDTSAIRDAQAVLEKYHLLENLGWSRVKLYETPEEDKYFAKVHNFLILSPKTTLQVLKERAEELGFSVKMFSENFQGEAKELGKQVVSQKNEKNTCLLGAGESTVKIIGNGQGGRNQEMALGALSLIGEDQVLLCLASDGHDNTEAAGAIADQVTRSKAKALGLDPQKSLDNNDSFRFFEETEDLVFTGQTGSNVSDFFICLKQ